MGQIIQITASNVDLCDSAVYSLRAHLDELAKLTVEYPVECQFAGYRFVFANRADIESMIEELDTKIRAYHASAA